MPQMMGQPRAALLTLLLLPVSRGYLRPLMPQSLRHATCGCRAKPIWLDETSAQLEEGIGGAVLNEELKVTVQYLGSAASRQRRVRRTKRPPPDERWRLSVEPAGYMRMSAFCNFRAINLEDLIDLLEGDVSFRRFGERVSITSYTDVVHVRFVSPEIALNGVTPRLIRDAFLFPYGSAVLWGFNARQELDLLDLISPCCEPLDGAGIDELSVLDDLGDSDFMLYTVEDDAAVTTAGTDLGRTPSATRTTISNNVIRLFGRDEPLERLSISFAFAQSAKLAVFEALLEATTERIKPIPQQLALRGRSKFSANEVGAPASSASTHDMHTLGIAHASVTHVPLGASSSGDACADVAGGKVDRPGVPRAE